MFLSHFYTELQIFTKTRLGQTQGKHSERNRFRTEIPGAGLFNYGDKSPANQHPCDEIAFAALSNQMLLQPNGASFEKDGMLGVAYVWKTRLFPPRVMFER